MNRNLKALGLALIAVFAMSGLAASAAQATNGAFQFEAGTTKLTAEAYPTDPSQVFGVLEDKFTFTCNELSGRSTSFSSMEVTAENIVFSDTGLTPTTDKCTAGLVNATVEMHGCDLRFTPGTTVTGNPGEPVTGTTEGTADIICPAGGEITIIAEAGCAVHIPEQTGVGPVYFHTVETGTKEEITVEAKINHVPVSLHNHGFKYKGTGFACNTGGAYKEDGSYTGKVTVKGDDINGNQTNITVT